MTQEPLRKDERQEPPLLAPAALVHLLGVCGTGMAALAGMFREKGFLVTGSDQTTYPPMSDFLAEMGVKVNEGYSPANLDPLPDLAVVGNVIRRANPEAVALEASGAPFVSMPEALVRYFAYDKTRIVVSGTHGKTTVSSMIAWILHRVGLDPGFMVGGIPKNFRKNSRLGQGPHFVIEGDEYDTAYFDKRPKFLHYWPQVAIITSCEFDHGDIYSGVQEIEEQFRRFVGLVPENGLVIACGDDPRVRRIVSAPGVPAQLYGMTAGCDWSVEGIEDGPEGIDATILFRGRAVARASLPVFGLHNVMNAVAAVAAAHSAGVAPQAAMEAMRSFEGVRRRQDILGEVRGALLIDDFAHHPTAVQVTCEAIKSRLPQRRLVAVFEPRTNTSRRAIFQQAYAQAFSAADLVVLREPRDAQNIPEDDRFSSDRLARDLESLGGRAVAFGTTEEIIDFLARELAEGDVALIMSNGSFDNLGPRLLDALKER